MGLNVVHCYERLEAETSAVFYAGNPPPKLHCTLAHSLFALCSLSQAYYGSVGTSGVTSTVVHYSTRSTRRYSGRGGL